MGELLAFVAQILFELLGEWVLRFTGMLLFKVIWPPNWFGKMKDDGVTFYIIGVLFYVLIGVYYLLA